MKRVFVIHGWDGFPEEAWFPWIKKELEAKGYKVFIPLMPNKSKPTIKSWVSTLKKLVKDPDENIHFIGHSIGCQTILRFLETLPEETKVGKCIFVAGWFNLVGLETKEEKNIAKPWINTNIDFENVKNKAKKFIAIFSDDDPFVPLGDTTIFEEKLGAEVIVESGKGHFNNESDITEIPIVLEKLTE